MQVNVTAIDPSKYFKTTPEINLIVKTAVFAMV